MAATSSLPFGALKKEDDVWTDLNANTDSSGKYHEGFLAAAKFYKGDVLAELKKNK